MNLVEDPEFPSVEAVKVHVAELVQQRFGFKPSEEQLVLCSALQALYCRILRNEPEPTIEQIYDFCEVAAVGGSRDGRDGWA